MVRLGRGFFPWELLFKLRRLGRVSRLVSLACATLGRRGKGEGNVGGDGGLTAEGVGLAWLGVGEVGGNCDGGSKDRE